MILSEVENPPGTKALASASRQNQALGLRSIGFKLAVAVFVMLGAASFVAGYQVSALALRHIIEGKEKAAVMVAEAASPALSAALDFGDGEAIAEQSRHILASRDVIGVAVWGASGNDPLLALRVRGWGRPQAESVHRTPATISVSRAVKSPSGKSLGFLKVEYSLAPEIAAFRMVQANIYVATFVLSVVLALLVIGLLRVTMLTPLFRLLAAMSSLGDGNTIVLADKRRDEIGRLARGFNLMSRAIEDRERSLAVARERTQQLLDHMQQAILVFDAQGHLLDLRSRVTESMFDPEALRGSVAEVLFPDETTIERELFDQWLNAVGIFQTARLAEVRDLAPTETQVRGRDGQERHLTLEFIPIVEAEALDRVMVLCTDVTEERRLQRSVEAKDVEHARQMQAMRALVAGGGQLLVEVLRRATQRLEQSRVDLLKDGMSRADVEQIFQRIHTVKGEARVFDQSELTRAAAGVEDTLSALYKNMQLEVLDAALVRDALEPGFREIETALSASQAMLVSASPIGPAVLDQITVRRQDLDALQAATSGRRDHIAAVAQRLASRPFGEALFNLSAAAGSWAEALHKRVTLDLQARDTLIPAELGRVLSGAITHLVRNAVAHGIELPRARLASGKAAVGVISVGAEVVSGGVRVVVKDDGQGASPVRLGRGTYSVEGPMFEPGFTQASQQQRKSGLAGHGMGLAAVRADVEGVGYRVHAINRPGLGFEVRIEPDTE